MIPNAIFRAAHLMSLTALVATVALTAHADEKTATATLNQKGLLGVPSSIKGPLAAVDPFVYSNTTNFLGQGYANGGAATNAAGDTQTSLVADDINLAGSQPTNVTGFTFSVVNFNAAATSARPRVRFYLADGTGGAPGTYLGGLNFNAISFGAGSVATFNYFPAGSPTLFTIPASTTFWAGMTFDDNTGATGATAAQLNNLGQGIYNPPTVGSSQDVFFQSTAAGSFAANSPAGGLFFLGGNPPANFGWRFTGTAAVPEPGAVALLMGFGVSGAALLRRRKTARK